MNNLYISTKPNKKPRNPNIDFIRILGMLAIIIDHLLFHGKLLKKYKKFIELQLLNIFCMWHVCSFGMVSGLVGNKSHKFSNLYYLWVLVLFYSIIFFFKYEKKNTPFYNTSLKTNLFPVIFEKYWYFTAYFGSYPFFHIISSGITSLSQIQIKKINYFILGIFIILASSLQDSFQQQKGHSPLSFLIFYILGSYIGKYIIFKDYTKFYKILICVVCASIFLFISFICFFFNIKNSFPKIDLKIKKIFSIQINSLPMILQASSLIIFVAQIKFNKYLYKLIIFIGPLIFDVYLIHENYYIRRIYIENLFKDYSSNLGLLNIFILILGKTCFIFSICIFFAYIRNILFTIIKIKNICYNFEILITKVINYLI